MNQMEAIKAIADQMTDTSAVQDAFDVLIEAATGEWKTKYDETVKELESVKAERDAVTEKYKQRFIESLDTTARSDSDVNEVENTVADDIMFTDLDWSAKTE